jgi:hypothetical protein
MEVTYFIIIIIIWFILRRRSQGSTFSVVDRLKAEGSRVRKSAGANNFCLGHWQNKSSQSQQYLQYFIMYHFEI